MSSKRHNPLENTARLAESSRWPYPLAPGPAPGAKTVPASSQATGSQTPRPILKHRSIHSCDDCQSPPTIFPVEGIQTAVQFAEDSSGPSASSTSPQIVPWPLHHPPWLPLPTNQGEFGTIMIAPVSGTVFRAPVVQVKFEPLLWLPNKPPSTLQISRRRRNILNSVPQRITPPHPSFATIVRQTPFLLSITANLPP